MQRAMSMITGEQKPIELIQAKRLDKNHSRETLKAAALLAMVGPARTST
jgi:hypothetical protein